MQDNKISAEQQKALIGMWFETCQRGRFEQADRIWELFCKELNK